MRKPPQSGVGQMAYILQTKIQYNKRWVVHTQIGSHIGQ